MKKVLVTGGAGYIGSHTVAKLLQENFEVFVLDNLTNGNPSLIPNQAQFKQGDVSNWEFVCRLLNDLKVSSVIHFAAYTSVEESLLNPGKYYQNNFQGTVHLLRACEKAQVRNFIFSSTAAVYAASSDDSLVSEASPLNPVTPYGASKLMSERALADFAASGQLRYMILRYFNVAGAEVSNDRGQNGDHHTALVKRAALAAVGKLPGMKIFGTDYPTADGTAVRDFIHVEDLAEIHVKALQKLMENGNSNILNCGYGRGYTVQQVITEMQKVEGALKFPVEKCARRPGDLPSVVADVSKLLKTLEWEPKRNDLRLICKTAFEWERKVKLCEQRNNLK